jgi:hypothetical protein
MKRRAFLSIGAAGAAGMFAGRTADGQQADDKPSDSASHVKTVTWTRTVPVKYEADVAVIGGGIAGVSAA